MIGVGETSHPRVAAAGVGSTRRLSRRWSRTGEHNAPGAPTNCVGVWGMGATMEGQGGSGSL